MRHVTLLATDLAENARQEISSTAITTTAATTTTVTIIPMATFTMAAVGIWWQH